MATRVTQAEAGVLRVYQPTTPSSLDPLTYDYSKHHAFQSIFHMKLTSTYRGSSGISPQLAISWKSSQSGTEWRFKIRNDVFFSNGDPVSAEVVVASLKRVIFFLWKNGTKNELVRGIKGIRSLRSFTSELPGLRADGDEVVFLLENPIEDLAEPLSFGLFAVTHESDYDKHTGEWLDRPFVESVGAGPYKIKEITKDRRVFVLREDYPVDLYGARPFPRIEFVADAKGGAGVDFSFGISDSSLFEAGFNFYGRGGRHVMYAHVLPWAHKGSPLSNKHLRLALREAYYERLNQEEFKVSTSFFPLTLPGVQEPVRDSVPELPSGFLSRLAALDIRFNEQRPSNSKMIDAALRAFEGAVSSLGMVPKAMHFTVEEIKPNKNKDRSEYSIDIALLGTGVSLQYPLADIRLLFSKEGVGLPDVDGSISSELEKESPNIQLVNELLFEQAVIWPFSRYDLGTWARDHLDLSGYNILEPPGELQWIGVK
jgi:ABC-type transport system substrate-binding protein